MARNNQIRHDGIVETANQLFYTRGYNATSLGDVANAVGISKGNLHYHFASKDALLEEVINTRLESITRNLDQWNQEFSSPWEKLRRFVHMLLNEENNLIRYGCPMGSLNIELGKDQLAMQEISRHMFDLYLNWLTRVFHDANLKPAKSNSLHLLAMAQGAVVMSHAYSSKKILRDECQRIMQWIGSLETGS